MPRIGAGLAAKGIMLKSRLELVLKIVPIQCDQLLGSDSREAVAICQAYVEAMIERASLALIVRQAEMLDQPSLKALLAFNRNATANLLILEYASSDSDFGRAHHKIIDQELALHRAPRLPAALPRIGTSLAVAIS